MRWIECHPGLAGYLQAAGSLLALLIAIAVPWMIHRQQDRTAREPHQRSIERLLGVLVNLLGFAQAMKTVSNDFGGHLDDGSPKLNDGNRTPLAVGLRVAYGDFKDTGALLGPAIEKADLEKVELIQVLARIKLNVENQFAQIEREREFLAKTPTIPVVQSSLDYGYSLGELLEEDLKEALTLLQPKIL